MPIHDFKCEKCEKEATNKIVSFTVADEGFPCANIQEEGEDKNECEGTMKKSSSIGNTSFRLRGRFH